MSQNILKFFIFIVYLFFFQAFFADNISKKDSCPDTYFFQLPNGQYAPLIKDNQKFDIEKDLSVKHFPLKPQQKSLIEKIRNFFRTPFNVSLPILGNIKNLYYLCEYHVTCAAQDFYEDVLPPFLLISKEQTVSIAHIYFFNLFAKWLTPTGIFDAVVSRILYYQVPVFVLKYNFSKFAVACTHQGLYSIYSILTKHLDTPWYIFAFLYHMGIRSRVNSYFKINRYAEMILLGLCAPKMFNYLV